MKKRVDVSICQQTKDGHYVLTKDMIPDPLSDNVPDDYRDMMTGNVVWHVARNKRTGLVVATDGDTYNRPGWESLWLR